MATALRGYLNRVKHSEVVIVGAGAAGLNAARILGEHGVSAIVLEARARIGGRIHTVRDPAFGVPVELGAEFVHGKPRATWDLLRGAGLVAYDLPFDQFQRRDGRLAHVGDFGDEMAPVMSGLARLGPKDVSFADYLRSHRGGTTEARRMAVAFVQGFDAADPERASAKALAEEMEGVGNVDEEPQFRIREGYGALVDHLRRSLARGRVAIRRGMRVSEVRWETSRVDVLCGARRTFRAARAIVTVPIGVLQVPPERPGSIRFVPEIAGVRRAAAQLASGPIVKVVLAFDRAFWEAPAVARATKAGERLRDAAFLHDPLAPFPTWWTALPFRVPVLTGWAGGPKAVALSGLSKGRLEDAALGSLSGIFGLPVARLRRMLARAHVCDWAADPLSRGAYSYVTVGGMRARSVLAKPVRGTLFFAGEATDTGGQASTVAGALASGERAARQVLATMR
jgi:monoamine oxidase